MRTHPDNPDYVAVPFLDEEWEGFFNKLQEPCMRCLHFDAGQRQALHAACTRGSCDAGPGEIWVPLADLVAWRLEHGAALVKDEP